MAKKGVREDIIARYGLTPLDFMMKTMTNPALEHETRLDAAKSAAPYVHAKLKQMEITDARDGRAPTEVKRDIEALLERAAGTNIVPIARGRRDLLG